MGLFMKLICQIIAIFLFILSSGNTFSQTKKEPFNLVDLRKLVNLSDPVISPDGNLIAVIVSKQDWEKDKALQNIELVDVKDGTMRSITFKREQISALSWSPDGNSLAFIAKDFETQKPQIFIMPMSGGDAECITNSKTGVTEFSWSPDGRKIAFVAQDTVPNPEAIKHHEDAVKVTYNNYLVRSAVQPWHLWIISSKGGTAKQLTKGTQSLCTDQETISPLEWTHDESSIIFQIFPDVWEGNAWHCTLGKVDTNGTNFETVIQEQGSSFPSFAPDNNILAFLRPRNGDQNNGNAVYISANNKIEDVTKNLARNINSYTWMPDGKSLLLTGEKGTQSVIWNQPLNAQATLLKLGDVECTSKISVSKNGVITFSLPKGSNQINLTYNDLFLFKISKLISLLSIALLVFTSLIYYLKRLKRKV